LLEEILNSIGGQTRNKLAELDITTGNALGILIFDSYVRTLFQGHYIFVQMEFPEYWKYEVSTAAAN